MTLLFLLTWQFAQFALLLHSLALFGMAILKLLNPDQVRKPFQILTTINSRIGFFSLEISKSSLGKSTFKVDLSKKFAKILQIHIEIRM